MAATTQHHLPREITISPEELRLFQDLMYTTAGINMPDTKANMVTARLRRRLDALGLTSFRAYFDHIRRPAHQAELQFCIEALTTNETFFFRHKQHWDYLLGDHLPDWCRQHRSERRFRAWSAACSTGEEPYSLALVLSSVLPPHRIHIDATDINNQVLERAKAGIYGGYAVQKLAPGALAKHFTQTADGHYRINDDLRRLVSFHQHNLMTPCHREPYDLILLRNVLIYFDHDSKAVVQKHIASRLNANGILILGGSETLANGQHFHCIHPTIYRKNDHHG
jgi:chemotaxis protein methyltransferase CheR